MNPASGRKVVTGTDNKGYMELNRMWVHDSQPRNTETRVISYALRYIRQVYPAVKWIQSATRQSFTNWRGSFIIVSL